MPGERPVSERVLEWDWAEEALADHERNHHNGSYIPCCEICYQLMGTVIECSWLRTLRKLYTDGNDGFMPENED